MIPLWKKENDLKEELEVARNKAIYDKLTIRELLNLGFNNNYLMLDNYNKVELGWVNEKGEYSVKLTDEQLNVVVYMKEDFGWYDDEDLDSEGYHIAKVWCANKFDEELFAND